MVRFERLPKDAFQRGSGGSKGRKIDLSPYFEMLNGLELGEGGMISLDEGDQQRTTKRRLTIAAHSQGFAVKWRTAPEGVLKFQLVEPKQIIESRSVTSAPARASTRRSSS